MSVATPLRSLVETTRQESSPDEYVPQYGLVDQANEAQFVVVPWSKWGKHRIYVNTADGQQVGWRDLDSGERSLALPQFATEFDSAIQNHAEDDYKPRRVITSSARQAFTKAAAPAPIIELAPTDLSGNRPGEQLEAQILAARAAGEELAPARPDFQGRRAYSPWELGVLGEHMVAEELDRLLTLDPRWSYINSIPVGTNGSDIDHLTVGPGGVFTINAKHHHDGKVWVGEDALMVNGVWQQYVRNSRHESERAGKLLSATTNSAIMVRGLVVPVGTAELIVKEQPVDVQVVEGSQLVDFLMSQPAVLDTHTIALVMSCARLSTTWR